MIAIERKKNTSMTPCPVIFQSVPVSSPCGIEQEFPDLEFPAYPKLFVVIHVEPAAHPESDDVC